MLFLVKTLQSKTLDLSDWLFIWLDSTAVTLQCTFSLSIIVSLILNATLKCKHYVFRNCTLEIALEIVSLNSQNTVEFK